VIVASIPALRPLFKAICVNLDTKSGCLKLGVYVITYAKWRIGIHRKDTGQAQDKGGSPWKTRVNRAINSMPWGVSTNWTTAVTAGIGGGDASWVELNSLPGIMHDVEWTVSLETAQETEVQRPAFPLV
jgi:hypothetical protein